MQDDEFESDDEKARTNRIKHKVDFQIARQVFIDPGIVDGVDGSLDYDEERFRAIGTG